MIDRLFSLSGRLGRLEYFGWSLAVTVFLTIVNYIGSVMHGIGKAQNNQFLIIMSIMIYLLGTVLSLWAGAALAAKRLHDVSLPAYHVIWILGAYLAWPVLVIMSLPDIAAADKIVVLIVTICLVFIPGTNGSNNYD